jgi:hypothetical protein
MDKRASLVVLSNYFKFNSSHRFFFYFIIIFEYLQILLGIIQSTNFDLKEEESYFSVMFYLNYISPYYYAKKSLNCFTNSSNNQKICGVEQDLYLLSTILPYVFILLLITLMIFYGIRSANKLLDFGLNFLAKVFEMLMTIFNMSLIFIFINKIVMEYNSQNTYPNVYIFIILMLLYFVNIFLFMTINIFQIQTNTMVVNLNSTFISYKENLFSPTYNYFLLACKILIAYRDNLILFKDTTLVTIFSGVILILFFVYALMIFYEITEKKVLFVILPFFNTLRIYGIVLTFFIVIFKLFFNKEDYFAYVALPFFIFSGLITHLIKRKNFKNIVESKHKIYQLSLVINELILDTGLNISTKQRITDLILSIKLHNNKYLDQVQEKYHKTDNNEEEQRKNMNELKFCNRIFKEIKRDMKRYTVSELKHFKLISLILYKLDLKKINKFKFAIKKELSRDFKMFDNHQINLVLIYNNAFAQLSIDAEIRKKLRTYKLLDTYNESVEIISKSIQNFEKILINWNTNLNDQFYDLTSSLVISKNKLEENLIQLHEKKDLFFDNISFFIINYTYEYIFNEKIMNINTDFAYEDSEIRDLLNHHYHNDDYILLSYSLYTDDLKILNASKDFANLKGEKFETIFPPRMRKSFKTKFMKILERQTRNNLDFLFYEENNTSSECIQQNIEHEKMNNIKRFNFRFLTYESFESDNIYIFGHYKFFEEVLILTRNINYDNGSGGSINEENVEDICSQGVELLSMNDYFAGMIRNRKIYITLPNLFQEAKINFPNATKYGKKKLFSINKSLLINLKSRYPEIIFKNMKITDKHEKKSNLLNSLEKSSIFTLSTVLQIAQDDVTYKVYSIGSGHPTTKDTFELKNVDDLNLSDMSHNMTPNSKSRERYRKQDNSMEGLNTDLNTSVAHSQQNIDTRFKKTFTRDDKKKKNSLIKNLSILILFYNCLLIIYCIIFLVIGYYNMTNLKNFYFFRFSYHDLRYFFYHTFMNVNQNILFYQQDNSDLSAYKIFDFYEKFKIQSGIKIDLADYCVEEMNVKFEMLKDKILNFKKLVSGADNKLIMSSDGKFNLNFDRNFEIFVMRKLSNSEMSGYSGDYFVLQSQNLNFFDALSMYLNFAYNSYTPGNTFTYINIITFFDGKADFSNINDNNLLETQISIYQVLINYAKFYKYFEEYAEVVDNLYADYLFTVFNTTVIMSIVVVILHVIYLLLSLYILRKFDQSLSKNNFILSKILTEKKIFYLCKKLKHVTKLNEINLNNPCDILGDLDKLYEASALALAKDKLDKINTLKNDRSSIYYKNKLKSSYFKDSGYLEDTIANVTNENMEIIKSKNFKNPKFRKLQSDMIMPLLHILLAVFAVYFLFYIFIFTYFNQIYDELDTINNFSIDFMNNQNKNINNMILFQNIIAINQTDEQLNEFIYTENSTTLQSDRGAGKEGYIKNNIKNAYKQIQRIKKFQKSDTFKAIVDFEKKVMDCKSGYTFDDSLYGYFTKTNTGLLDDLSQICKTYNFMNTINNFDNIQDELLYKIQSLLHQYEFSLQDYKNMKTIRDQYSYYDMFIINLLIMRPFSEYITKNLISTAVVYWIDYFLIFSTIYMVGTIFIDMFIFYLIRKLIIRKIQQVDREIRQFSLFILN